MPAEPIRYLNRALKTMETEQVFGEGWLRWTYENAIGRMALHALVKRALVSRLYGWRMNRRYSAQQVLPFIANYDLNVDEFAKRPYAFRSFNDFFFRALKPGARPIAADDRVAVLPADGRHLAFPNLDSAAGFYAKGQQFSLASFLGEAGLPEEQRTLTREFAGGSLLISRLCPVDYHRFHFPVAGLPGAARLINGWLYSVSPIALRRNLAYLWENKRMLTRIASPVFGSVLMAEIGATMVGTIRQTYAAGRPAGKGEEKGLFTFGGSCVVTLFQPGRIRFDDDLVNASAQQTEVYARMGERLGVAGS